MRLLPLTLILAALIPPLAHGQSELTGPARLVSGQHARYRLELAGDPQLASCWLQFRYRVPPDFLIVDATPAEYALGDDGRTVAFAAVPKLAPGGELAFELELRAPDVPTFGQICAELDFSGCTDDGPSYKDGPICLDLEVAEGSDAVTSIGDIPCGTRPVVNQGGGVVDIAQWTDAVFEALPTTPPSTIYAKTASGSLFVAVQVQDPAPGGDRLKLYINTNRDAGPPDPTDRGFYVIDANTGDEMQGTPTGYDNPIARNFRWEIQDSPGVEYWVEMEIPLLELSIPLTAQVFHFGLEIAPISPTRSFWPPTFDGVDEAPMSVSIVRDCDALRLPIRCGSRPTVTPGGSTYNSLQWADATVRWLGTDANITMRSKIDGPDLFVALEVHNGPNPTDAVRLDIDTNDDGGRPDFNDRAFEVNRSGVGIQYRGRSSGFDRVMLPITFDWEVATVPGGFAVEMRIPLIELGGPTPDQPIKLAVDTLGRGIWPSSFDGVFEDRMADATLMTCGDLQWITCGTQPTVTTGGGQVVPSEWSDAARLVLRTIPPATLYAKTRAGHLYAAVEVQAPPSNDRVKLYFDVNNDGGLPEGVDRAFHVRNAATAQQFAGRASGFDLPIPVSFQWEVEDMADRYWVEFDINLNLIGGPQPRQPTRIGVGISPASASPDFWPAVFAGVLESDMGPTVIFDCTCPPGNFSGGPGCVNEPISFMDLSAGPPTEWSWMFGDGSPVDRRQNPTHAYPFAGTFQLNLLTDGPAGCLVARRNVVVNRRPVPRLIVTPALVCVDATLPTVIGLNASGSSPGSGTVANPGGYAWTTTLGMLGGGNAATETLTVPPGMGGLVNVTVQVTNSNGCADGLTQEVQLALAPQPIIAASPLAVCSDPLNDVTVTLDASGSLFPGGGPTAWDWAVPLGHTIVGSGPVVDWIIPAGTTGSVVATLDLLTINGCSAQEMVTVDLYDWPTPALVLNPPTLCIDPAVPSLVGLDASGSTAPPPATIPDPGGYAWLATLGTTAGGNASSELLTVPAGISGSSDITVAVTDSNGCSAPLTRTAELYPPPQPALVATPDRFCADALNATTVRLDAEATIFPGGGPQSWVWTVPPGHSVVGVGALVDWIVPAGAAGMFTATVTVTDLNGCAASLSVDIEVTAPPIAGVTADPLAQCVDLALPTVIDLDASTSTPGPGATIANPGGYAWSTTLGSTGGGTSVTEVCTVPAGIWGIADISVVVTDSNTCDDRSTVSAALHPPPIAALAASPLSRCTDPLADITIALDARATTFPGGGPQSWTYTVPPGHSIVGSGPVVDWVIPAGTVGNFLATVAVTDVNGCVHTASVSIDLLEAPVPALALNPVVQCIDPTVPSLVDLDGSGSMPGPGQTIADPGGYGWTTTLGGIGASSASRERLTVPAGTFGVADVTLRTTDSSACFADIVRQARLDAPPVPLLTASPLRLCSDPLNPSTITLDARATTFPGSGPQIWSWTVPPGHSIVGSGPLVDWQVPPGSSGTFTATVSITAVNGCVSSISVDVEVTAAPGATLVATPLTQCIEPTLATVVDLDASGSIPGPGATIADPGGFAWVATLGAVGTSTGSRETLTVPAGVAGTADVTVTVTNSNSCTDVELATVELFAPPVPDLVATPLTRCSDPIADMLFGLDAATTVFPGAGPSAWNWTVPPGHGIVGTGPVVDWRVPAGSTGSFSASLDVVDDNGCARSIDVTITIYPAPIALQAPVARFTCTAPGQSPTLAFDGTGSSATPPATLTGYAWLLTGPAAPPTGTAPTLSSTYPAGTTGAFAASLTVTDSFGCSAVANQDFSLGVAPSAVVTLSPGQCADPLQPTLLNADASASSAVPPATLANPGSFAWSASLGTTGGSTGALETVTVAPGSFGVSRIDVTVTDSTGCAASTGGDVLVVAPPEVAIAAVPLQQCEGPTGATFHLTSGGSRSNHPNDPSLAFAWTSSEPTLTAPGAASTDLQVAATGVGRNITVSLDIVDALGCTVPTASLQLRLDPSPQVAIASTVVRAGEPSQFTATVTGGTPPYGLQWSFGDGAGAGGNPVEHVYQSPGSYTVTVTVTDANLCRAEAAAATVIDVGRRLAGTLVAADACQGEATRFSASVTGGVQPFDYAWDFGDGVTANAGPTAEHVYASAGGQRARLVVTDARGTTLRLSAPAQVAPTPQLSIAIEGAGAAGVEQRFIATSDIPGTTFVWTFSDGSHGAGDRVLRSLPTLGPATVTVLGTTADGCRGAAQREFDLGEPTVSLRLAKTARPYRVARDGDLEYVLVVAAGPSPLRDLWIEDRLPAGFVYRPGSLTSDGIAMPEPADRSVLRIGPLNLGADGSTTVRYRVHVDPDVTSGEYDNEATVRGQDVLGRPIFSGPQIATVAVFDDRPAVLELVGASEAPACDGTLSSDRYDAAAAMRASAAMLDAARAVAAVESDPPLTALAGLPALRARLTAIAASNIQELWLDSGRGLAASGPGTSLRTDAAAPVALPFAEGHLDRDAASGWCDHPRHRFTTPATVGYGALAIASYFANDIDAAPDDRARAALAACLEGIAQLRPAIEADRLPALISLGVTPNNPASEALASLADRAALARGLAALAALPPALVGDGVGARLTPVVRTLVDGLARDLTTQQGGVQPAELGTWIAAAAAFAEAERAGVSAPPGIYTRVQAALAQPTNDDSLGGAADRLIGALRSGRPGLAVPAWRSLAQLPAIATNAPAQATVVTVTTEALASAVTGLSEFARVAASASPDASHRSAALADLATLIDRIYRAGRLQDVGDSGDTGHARATRRRPRVLVDRLSWVVPDKAIGVADRVLRGIDADDCQQGRARIVDPRFVAATDLAALLALQVAADHLTAPSSGLAASLPRTDPQTLALAARLRASALAGALTIATHSGAGVPLEAAPDRADASPAGPRELWLTAAEATPPADRDQNPWTVSDPRVTPGGLALGILRDLSIAAQEVNEAHKVTTHRLQAARLQLQLLRRTLRDDGQLTTFHPATTGTVTSLRPEPAALRLGDSAAALWAVSAADAAGLADGESAGQDQAGWDAVQEALRRSVTGQLQSANDAPALDLWLAVQALTANRNDTVAGTDELDPSTRSLAIQTASRIANATQLSTLARRGLQLEATVRAGVRLDPAAIAGALDDLGSLVDPSLDVFRPEPGGAAGSSFELSALDGAAVTAGLAAVTTARPDGVQGARLIRMLTVAERTLYATGLHGQDPVVAPGAWAHLTRAVGIVGGATGTAPSGVASIRLTLRNATPQRATGPIVVVVELPPDSRYLPGSLRTGSPSGSSSASIAVDQRLEGSEHELRFESPAVGENPVEIMFEVVLDAKAEFGSRPWTATAAATAGDARPARYDGRITPGPGANPTP